MVDMKPRNVATSQMVYRESSDSSVFYYRYNEPKVKYNESFVTYNYSSQRGNLVPRTILTPNMRGR